MPPYTKSKFAELCGVTRQAINGAVKKGVLKMDENGHIDPDDPHNRPYYVNIQARISHKERQIGGASKSEQVEGLESLDVLNRKHKAEQIRKLEIETQTKRGELIPRALVEKVFSKLNMIDQTEFLNLGQNLAPSIMAIGKIKDETKELEIKAAIDSAIYRCLDTVKKELDKFLEQTDKETHEPGT